MNRPGVTTPHRVSLPVFSRVGQYFFLITFAAVATLQAIQLREGNNYPLTFTDVDRDQLSTADGHVTIITVLTRKDEDKAQAVGDRVPRIYYGDPKFRLITLVNFQRGSLIIA